MNKSVRETIDNACCFRPLDEGGLRVIYEITKRCNLSCIHCMVTYDNEELPKKRIFELMYELPGIKASKVMFTGGEPLLIPYISSLIEILSEQYIITDLNSNLTMLTNDLAKKLKSAGLSEATTSLDGCEYSHNFIRRNQNAYAKTIKGIEYLAKENIPVDVVCIVTKHTTGYLQDAAYAAFQHGAESITYSGLILEGKATENMLPNDKQVTEAFDDIRSKFNKPVRTVRLINQDYSECHKGSDIIGIDSGGYIHPCLLSKIEKHISLKEYSLEDAVNLLRILKDDKASKCG